MKANAVVVVGERFDPGMVSPERLFDRAVDPTRLLAGPIAQYTYGSGVCAFQLTPDRIVVSTQSQEVLPEELRLAADKLFFDLENIRAAIDVNGVGLNCDAVLPMSANKGREISNSLTQFDMLRDIAGMPHMAEAKTSLVYDLNGVVCTLRIEPEHESGGQNLFVAVNGHQNVNQSFALAKTLDAFTLFRNHVESIHDSIYRTFP